MSKWILGTALIAIGLVLIGYGLASRGDSPTVPVEATQTTTEVMPVPVTQPSSTTTTASPATSTTSPVSTTSVTISTTTTTAPPPSVEEFIISYSAAAAGGDGDFLFDRLLPELVDIFGSDTCRAFVENEIVALRDYTLTGEVSGPFSRTLNVGDDQIEVDRYDEAPVRFTFQGQSFYTTATFVAQDGLVYWIGECR